MKLWDFFSNDISHKIYIYIYLLHFDKFSLNSNILSS